LVVLSVFLLVCLDSLQLLLLFFGNLLVGSLLTFFFDSLVFFVFFNLNEVGVLLVGGFDVVIFVFLLFFDVVVFYFGGLVESLEDFGELFFLCVSEFVVLD
jgi:hypothetical protein